LLAHVQLSWQFCCWARAHRLTRRSKYLWYRPKLLLCSPPWRRLAANSTATAPGTRDQMQELICLRNFVSWKPASLFGAPNNSLKSRRLRAARVVCRIWSSAVPPPLYKAISGCWPSLKRCGQRLLPAPLIQGKHYPAWLVTRRARDYARFYKAHKPIFKFCAKSSALSWVEGRTHGGNGEPTASRDVWHDTCDECCAGDRGRWKRRPSLPWRAFAISITCTPRHIRDSRNDDDTDPDQTRPVHVGRGDDDRPGAVSATRARPARSQASIADMGGRGRIPAIAALTSCAPLVAPSQKVTALRCRRFAYTAMCAAYKIYSEAPIPSGLDEGDHESSQIQQRRSGSCSDRSETRRVLQNIPTRSG
jgi:hypothetical protein